MLYISTYYCRSYSPDQFNQTVIGYRKGLQLNGLNYQERLGQLNLPTLYYRRKRFDLIQLLKIVYGLPILSKSLRKQYSALSEIAFSVNLMFILGILF